MNAVLAALEPIARVAVATLFNSLWEAALLALAVWAVLHFVPNLNAATRYAAWCVALAAAIVLPLATTLPRVTLQQDVVYEHLTQSSTRQVPASTAALRTAHAHPRSSAAHSHPAVQTQPVQRATPSGFRLPARPHLTVPSIAALVLFALWVVVALAILVRLILNLFKLESLKRDALPLPVDYREHLKRWEDAAKGARDVRLCVSDKIEVPIAVGLFDSMVLIPEHLLATLSQDEIDQITLHELGHLRRADDWTNAFQRIVQALFFFNPAILWIAQQLDLEREVACDDWVLATTREVRPYAFCLTKMAEATTWPHRPLAAPGVFVTRKSLSIRVERLLRAGRNIGTGIAFGPTGAVAAALIVLFFVLQSVAPSIAYTLPDTPQLAQATAAPSPAPSVSPVATPTASATPALTPKAAPKPTPTPHVIIEKHIEYRTVTTSVRHVHIPERTVHIPEINVDFPQHTFAMPPMPHTSPLPPGFRDLKTKMHESLRGIGFAPGSSVADVHGCTGCDMSGANLVGHDFRNQSYTGSDFARANLQNADFRGAVLTGADFRNANLRGARFENASMEGCDFRGADLTGATLDGAKMTGCDIDVSRLSPSQARAVFRSCTGCDFSHANLRGQDLRNVSIEGDDMAYADLRGADLSGVNFTGIDLHGAQLDGAKLDGATFTGCDFTGVNLHNVDLSRARIVGSKLSGSQMR
ncbi:MAG: pentapeptide repeat-containing protein [Vulcanimicrobiaceae bacterium]